MSVIVGRLLCVGRVSVGQSLLIAVGRSLYVGYVGRFVSVALWDGRWVAADGRCGSIAISRSGRCRSVAVGQSLSSLSKSKK